MTQELQMNSGQFLCIETGHATIKPTTIISVTEPIIVVLPVIIHNKIIYDIPVIDNLSMFNLIHSIEMRGPPYGVIHA